MAGDVAAVPITGVFVIAGYPQGGIVFYNLVVFIFYMCIGNLINLSSGAMSIPIKCPLSI